MLAGHIRKQKIQTSSCLCSVQKLDLYGKTARNEAGPVERMKADEDLGFGVALTHLSTPVTRHGPPTSGHGFPSHQDLADHAVNSPSLTRINTVHNVPKHGQEQDDISFQSRLRLQRNMNYVKHVRFHHKDIKNYSLKVLRRNSNVRTPGIIGAITSSASSPPPWSRSAVRDYGCQGLSAGKRTGDRLAIGALTMCRVISAFTRPEPTQHLTALVLRFSKHRFFSRIQI
ncbi:hypothetical protein J6590_047810 [Homalodisca vitripennis]|nr:hypothetical protein J6590_047810 [Homalodisca vitripennis]